MSAYYRYFCDQHNKEFNKLYHMEPIWDCPEDIPIARFIPNFSNVWYAQIQLDPALRFKYKPLMRIHFNMQWIIDVLKFIRTKWREECIKNRINRYTLTKYRTAKEHIKKVSVIDANSFTGKFF